MGRGGAADLLPALGPRLDLVRQVGELGENLGHRVYLVGGVVRDLVLGRPHEDLDLVICPDPPPKPSGFLPLLHRILDRLQADLPVVVVKRTAFGTAALRSRSGGIEVDVALARSESYPRAGQLPLVGPGTVSDDLIRRDFTVNAMGIEVTPRRWGLWLDPYGGQVDLQRRVLRVLHEESFRDDPTRVVRAARFAGRLDMSLEPATAAALEGSLAAGHLRHITAGRFLREFYRSVDEAAAAAIIGRLEAWGVGRVLEPPMDLTPPVARAFARLAGHPRLQGLVSRHKVLVLLTAWATHRASRLDLNALAMHVELDRHGRKMLADVLAPPPALIDLLLEGGPPLRFADLLDGLRPEAIAALGATLSEAALDRSVVYLEEIRPRRPRLGGRDLMALGVPRGPLLGRLLRALRREVLAGRLTTAAEERRWVLARLGEEAT